MSSKNRDVVKHSEDDRDFIISEIKSMLKIVSLCLIFIGFLYVFWGDILGQESPTIMDDIEHYYANHQLI